MIMRMTTPLLFFAAFLQVIHLVDAARLFGNTCVLQTNGQCDTSWLFDFDTDTNKLTLSRFPPQGHPTFFQSVLVGKGHTIFTLLRGDDPQHLAFDLISVGDRSVQNGPDFRPPTPIDVTTAVTFVHSLEFDDAWGKAILLGQWRNETHSHQGLYTVAPLTGGPTMVMVRSPPFTGTCNNMNHWVDTSTHTMYCWVDMGHFFLEMDLVHKTFVKMPLVPPAPAVQLACIRRDPFSSRVVGLNVTAIPGTSDLYVQFVEVIIIGAGTGGSVQLKALGTSPWRTPHIPCNENGFTGPAFGPNGMWYSFVADERLRPPYQQYLVTCDWAGTSGQCTTTTLGTTAFMGPLSMFAFEETT